MPAGRKTFLMMKHRQGIVARHHYRRCSPGLDKDHVASTFAGERKALMFEHSYDFAVVNRCYAGHAAPV
jgi:hypothetical protein